MESETWLMGKTVVDETYGSVNWKFMMLPAKPVLVTSAAKNGKPNVMTVAWNMLCSHEPRMVAIAIHPERYSFRLIEETKEFTLNVPTLDLSNQVQYCGEYSGRYVDKFKDTNLTPKLGKKVKAPSIDECIAFMECKVVNQFTTGDHVMFIGEVVHAEAEEELIEINLETRKKPNRYFNPEKSKTLLHLGAGIYISTSPKLYKPDLRTRSRDTT